MTVDAADPRQVRALLRRASPVGVTAVAVEQGRAEIRAEVKRAFEALRDQMVRRNLANVPIGRLREVTGERVRLGPLENAGFRTVLDVMNAFDSGSPWIPRIPGVGEKTVTQIVAAARQLAAAVRDSIGIRFDLDPENREITAVLVALRHLDTVERILGQAMGGTDLTALAEELPAAIAAASPARGRVRSWFAGAEGRTRAAEAVARVNDLLDRATSTGLVTVTERGEVVGPLRSAAELAHGPAAPDGVWEDFERHSPEYYSLLGQIVDLDLDVAAAEGGLPAEIAERVRAQQLDDSFRRVSLRGYQAFGARFALVQRRVVIGDEMGLGKTIQAIAALAHLRALGSTHFLVVAPAAVLVNWVREIDARSRLVPYRLHGQDRTAELQRWAHAGGVAVTTFDMTRTLEIPPGVEIAMLVVDEAHYIKNPQTQRSQAVRALGDRAGRVLYLTGTPMENRLAEFEVLVDYLQPGLTPGSGRGSGRVPSETFRRAVAPAYLRRNVDDVLSELPRLIQVEEVEEFSRPEALAYRRAVFEGSFMAMRQAAYPAPGTPAGEVGKLRRLLDIVTEAAANGRKVVVFSYFLGVLETVRRAIETDLAATLTLAGPIDGRVAPTARQRIVDEFTAARGPAVLVSQITAGGVGLNMQAASVVILCEPQLKPTVEEQAIARCHRMGQVRGVQVHRLVSAEGVDRRLLEILAGKRREFDAYARRSAVAEGTPDAVDISEQELARQIIQAEQLRMAGEGVPG